MRRSLPEGPSGPWLVIDPNISIGGTGNVVGGAVNSFVDTASLTGINRTTRAHLLVGRVDVSITYGSDGSVTYSAHGYGEAGEGPINNFRDFMNDVLGPSVFATMGENAKRDLMALGLCN